MSLVARDREFAIILDQIARRKSLHIYGEGGTGKSALLDEVYNFLKARGAPIPIYCRSSRMLREILLHTSGFLLDHLKHLSSINKFKEIKDIESYSDVKRLNIRTLRNLTSTYITQKNFCIILDHLEYVTPRINSFLTTLYERVPVISASRQSWELSDYGFKGRLDYCLYLTPKLRIEHLSREDAFALMERIAGGDLREDKHLFEEIYRITKGNAGLARAIILKALMPKYRVAGRPNLRLIKIDLAIEKAKEFPRYRSIN
jgi:hypothetical protein